MRYKRIVVEAAKDHDTLVTDGADVWSEWDTVKEAKERAKYYLTEDYRRNCEASERLGYSQVLADGEVLYDYFAK